MFCTNCGSKLPDGAKFCESCGAQVIAAPQQASLDGQPAPQETNVQQNVAASAPGPISHETPQGPALPQSPQSHVTNAATMPPEPPLPAQQPSQATQGARPPWLIPAIAITAVIIIGVIIGVFSCSQNTSGQSPSSASSGSNVALTSSNARDSFVGTWELQKGTVEGLDEQTLNALRKEGLSNTMTLAKDGTGEFNMMGSASSLTWEATSATEGSVTFGNNAMTMALDGDTLVVTNSSKETLTFVPEGTLAGSGTTSSSSQASSSASASSSSSSGASSSITNTTGKTTEYQSESGFAFTVDTGYKVLQEKDSVRIYTGKEGQAPWITITPNKKTGTTPAETLLQSLGEKAAQDYSGAFVVEPTAKKVQLSDGRVVKGIEYAYQKSGEAKTTQVLTYVDELEGNAMSNGFMYVYVAVCPLDDYDTPVATQLAMETFHFLVS